MNDDQDKLNKLDVDINKLEYRMVRMRLGICELVSTHRHSTSLALGKALALAAADFVSLTTQLDAYYEVKCEIMNRPYTK